MSRAGRGVRGTVTIELALVMSVFLILVFGTLEVTRLMYVVNTVQEVTRVAARMASMTDFSDDTALDAVRQRALLRDSPGALPLAPNLGAAQLRIEYLGEQADGDAVPLVLAPTCPQQNIVNCTLNPYGGSCIRYVRASICRDADGACTALSYQPMIAGLIPGLDNIRIPMAATLVKAETLGYRPGVNNCL